MTTAAVAPLVSDILIVQELFPGAARGLAGLSAAEALTDGLAQIILTLAGVPNPIDLVNVVHGCDFVVHRDAEWRLTDDARQFLRSELAKESALKHDVHSVLLALSSRAGVKADDSIVLLPNYLVTGPGLAYHSAELDVLSGLSEYSELGHIENAQIGWLANRLATDQQARGVLPAGSLQLNFLRGMVLYREGRHSEALELLRPLSESRDESREVAVATHIVGKLDAQHGDELLAAIKMLRRSLRIGRSLGDERHIAHASHSLALALLRRGQRGQRERPEALGLLDESAKITARIGDIFGLAKVLHTAGQARSHPGPGKDPARAQRELQESLRIGEQLGYRRHQARVLRTLSKTAKTERERLAFLERAKWLEDNETWTAPSDPSSSE